MSKRRCVPREAEDGMEVAPDSGCQYFDDVTMDSDYDVFGHGGSLDQGDAQGHGGRGSDGPAGEEQPRETPSVHDIVDAEGDERMTAELQGASMPMLLAALRNAPKRLTQDHAVLTFNASSGKVVRAKLRLIEEQVRSLRARGVRDDDQFVADHRMQAPRASPSSGHEGERPEGVLADGPSQRQESATTFNNRADLIRHLKRGSGSVSAGPSAPSRKPKRKSEAEAVSEVEHAVASSICKNAVGTRAGPGDLLREAGATAAAAAHLRGAVAAAVTADRMVAALSTDDLPQRIPPTVAPPRWTAEGTPEAPSQFRLPRPRGEEDPYGDGQHSGENILYTTVGGPLWENARRRDGADETSSGSLVARCGADATGPGVEKGPSEGSAAHGVPGARNECSDLRRRPGDDNLTCTVDDGANHAVDGAGRDGKRRRVSGNVHAGAGALCAEDLRVDPLHRHADHPRELRGSHRLLQSRARWPPPAAALPPLPPLPGHAHPEVRGEPLCRRRLGAGSANADELGLRGGQDVLGDHKYGGHYAPELERQAASTASMTGAGTSSSSSTSAPTETPKEHVARACGASQENAHGGDARAAVDMIPAELAGRATTSTTTPERSVAGDCGASQEDAQGGDVRKTVDRDPAEPVTRAGRPERPPRQAVDEAGIRVDMNAAARSMTRGDGCPAYGARRRITGKRKVVRADGAWSHEFDGPAFKLPRNAGELHAVSAGASCGARSGNVDHDDVGSVMQRSRSIHASALHSSTRGRRRSEAQCAGDSSGAADEPPNHGEMNTEKCTSFYAAAKSSGGPSSERADGAVAAVHPLTGVG